MKAAALRRERPVINGLNVCDEKQKQARREVLQLNHVPQHLCVSIFLHTYLLDELMGLRGV